MLDLRRLRLLRELRVRGTLAAVAEAMSYTPSAVSQQLAVLEREAGVELLERVGRGVRLTDAAEALVDHTEVVLARLELAESELAAIAGGTGGGRVRVAAYQTAARGLVAPTVSPLAAAGVRCELLEMEGEEALPALRLGDVDLVIAEEYPEVPRPRDPALERIDIARDRLVLALAADHPAAQGGGPIRLRDLADEDWCSTRAGTLFEAAIVRACRARGGFEPRVRHRANDVRLLVQIAAAGLAVALVPMLGQPEREPGVAVRPVAGPPLERLVFATVRRGGASRPAVAAAIDAIRAQVEQIGLARP